ncbi:WhiB family transcriptional regulator [Mycobacterium sp. SMC-19]|uniref:WhiB family transcriptional regulator n=1 Tax=Mycobacterium sp. SMC-19 TaxID=3381630 RepID=UPI00387748D0
MTTPVSRGHVSHANLPDADATITVLGAILSGVPRLTGAACRNHTTVFFAAENELRDGIEAAIRICARCPALAECRTWVEAQPSRRRPTGVTAGLLHPSPVSTSSSVGPEVNSVGAFTATKEAS